MKGVDISGWQSGFNVGAADADFVFIKATGGGSFTSAEFAAQTASAQASGKPHGFYHYANEKGCAADPITEANHFITTTNGLIGPGVGVALDWEETNLGNTAWAHQWLEHVRQALGRPASTMFIYMSQATVNAYDWSAVINAGYRLWCAQYPTMTVQGYGPVTNPPPVNWGAQGITMWQYSSAGRINGWGGNLDLNILYTDWGTIHGVTGQASSITPIQEGFLMALTDEQQAQAFAILLSLDKNVMTKADGHYIVTTVPDQTADKVLNTPIQKQGGGTTTASAELSWLGQNFANVPAAVWNQPVGTGNAAGVLNHIDAKPAVVTATNTVTGAPFDTEAFINELVAKLPPAIRADLKNAL